MATASAQCSPLPFSSLTCSFFYKASQCQSIGSPFLSSSPTPFPTAKFSIFSKLHYTTLHSLSLPPSLSPMSETTSAWLKKVQSFLLLCHFTNRRKSTHFFHSIFCWVTVLWYINDANSLWCDGHFLILYFLPRLHHLPSPHCGRHTWNFKSNG